MNQILRKLAQEREDLRFLRSRYLGEPDPKKSAKIALQIAGKGQTIKSFEERLKKESNNQ